MELQTFLQKIEPWAHRFGISFEVRKDTEKVFRTRSEINFATEGYHPAPFNNKLGIYRHRSNGILRVVIDSSIPEREFGGVIHEMGHLIFDFHGSDETIRVDEYDWLGWEYLFAKACGVFDLWNRSMVNYVVENPVPTSRWDKTTEWTYLNDALKQTVIKNRLAALDSKFGTLFEVILTKMHTPDVTSKTQQRAA